MRVNFSGPLRLVASAMLACLWSCQDRVQFDPSLTYQALNGDLGVNSLEQLSAPNRPSWPPPKTNKELRHSYKTGSAKSALIECLNWFY